MKQPWTLLCAFAALTACSDDEPTPNPDVREDCTDRNELKNVYFGDLHVHTALSFDAWVFDVRNTPADAYRFAKGEALPLPPLKPDGSFARTIRIDRPLDFAAVTDHSEYLGEVSFCSTPGSPSYDSETCSAWRRQDRQAVIQFGFELTRTEPMRFEDVCPAGPGQCLLQATTVWKRVQEAAEAAYDRSSACSFTSFVAYEYSGGPGVSNMHRNVIFKNRRVPSSPAAYFEHPRPDDLWAALDKDCLSSDSGCDVLAIPHNSNWSNGNLFHVEYPGASSIAEERAQAESRAQLEPLIEIFQHKGDSECSPGLSGIIGAPDELCSFEKLRVPPFEDCGDGTGSGAMAGFGCVSRLDFVRGILLAGLKEEERIGVNPYPLGIIASTDTHNGTPGAVGEADYAGHWGNNEDSPDKTLGDGIVTPGGVIFNGGGLAAIWAEENSRDAIFDSMRRREVYGTSGPRITLRMFGGWDYPVGLCGDDALVETGYAQGVPMGASLAPMTTTSTAPRIVVAALQDLGTAERPGTPLQRLQIVKGWVDAEGQSHIEVFDVAGDPDNGASVDPATCQTSGSGSGSLCAVWTDPSFDAARPAFYYARAVENPSCRWNAWMCGRLAPADRPPNCDAPDVPKTIQERAWSSPIWYRPR